MTALPFCSFLWLVIFAVPSSFAADAAKIHWPKPLEASQGDFVEITVGGEDLLEVDGLLGKERIYFHSREKGVHSALVGVDVEAKPATVKLLLKAIYRRRRTASKRDSAQDQSQGVSQGILQRARRASIR